MIDTFWRINHDNPAAKDQVHNIGEMHRNVCTMLGSDRASEGALWAFDRFDVLIIRSHEMPNIHALNALGVTHGVREPLLTFVASAIMPTDFAEGESFEFQLTINPVKQIGKGSRNNTTGRDQRIVISGRDWLASRYESLGFEARGLTERRYTARGSRSGKPIIYAAAAMSGTLTVTDSALFLASMTKGIGRGKAYGMGLLTLA